MLQQLKSLAGQTAVYGLGTIIPRVLNYLLLTPFYTRVLLKGEYGQASELYAYIALLLVLLTYGMETTFFRFARDRQEKTVFQAASGSVILTTLIFFLFTSLSYRHIASWIGYSGHDTYILLFLGIVSLDAIMAVPFARLRLQNKAGLFTALKITNVGINILWNLIFLKYIPEFFPDWLIRMEWLNDRVGLVLFSNLIASIVSLLLLSPQLKNISFHINLKLLREMLLYAWPLLIVGLAGMFNEVGDKILLKYLLPNTETALSELGIYAANYRIAVLMTLFIQMFRYAAEPFFFQYYGKKDDTLLYAQVMRFFVLAGLLIFLLITFYIDVFALLIGKEFREGIFIVPIILMANLFNGVLFNLSIWYKLSKRTRAGAWIAVIGVSLTIFLNIILVPVYGYEGAAWTHLFAYLVMVGVSYYWGRKVYPIPYPWKRLAIYLMIALGLFFGKQLFDPGSDLLRYALYAIIWLVFLGVICRVECKPFRNTAP